jgi:cytoskeletal protein CcmA (bactofilin family)
MEYVAAKSTMCRQCGGSFVPSAPKPEIRLKSKPEPVVTHDTSILRRFDSLWKPRGSSIVQCFECGAKQEISDAASSTICPACSRHIDLRDYKITTSFSRIIRTHGQIHVTSRGDLSSTNLACRSALIEGRLRGNLDCAGPVTIAVSGKIPGRISAHHLLIERKAEVQFFRRVRVKSVEIRGHMTGEIVAETAVIIHRGASLEGNVTAKAITVEKGGIFSGQLIIGNSGLTQGELLPEAKPAAKPARESEIPGAVAHPLPAT